MVDSLVGVVDAFSSGVVVFAVLGAMLGAFGVDATAAVIAHGACEGNSQRFNVPKT